MRAVVVGAAGQVGGALSSLLDDAIPITRAELDLTDLDAIAPVLRQARPELVVNAAAYNAVDTAEEEPALAHAVNAAAVGRMAEVAAELGAAFVTFSTDYVFDGEARRPYLESDRPSPLGEYARSKLRGEELALARSDRSLVIRTAWVMSDRPSGNFAATVLRVAIAGGGRFVTDQVGTPTVATDLAAATLAAIEQEAAGVLHLANQGEVSRHDLARSIVAFAGMDPGLIGEVTTAEYAAAAARPAYSALGSERLGELGVRPLPPWRDSLPPIVARLAGALR